MAKILIKELLEEKKIKTKRIVDKVPFSRATVYRMLSGEKTPTIDELEEFARELDVPLEDLYESEYSRENMKNKSVSK